jgi:cyclopropane-fatty-acyl-phospholipid synthase
VRCVVTPLFRREIDPSLTVLLSYLQHLRIEEHWRINGTHYQRTLEAWLRQMDTRKDAILPILARAYGEHQALKW